MPKKRGRASAGRQVQAIAQAFADALLVDEEAAFVQAAGVFRRPVAEARRELGEVWRRHREDPTRTGDDQRYARMLARTHMAAAAGTVDIAERLGKVAISKGLAAVGQELKLCEDTLSTRYRGVADLAVQGGTEAGEMILADALTAYRVDADYAAVQFDARARMQLRQSQTLDEMLLRLFSEEPAGLRGFSGRGVWWWTASDVNTGLRAVSIRCANAARISAMATFNEVARGR